MGGICNFYSESPLNAQYPYTQRLVRRGGTPSSYHHVFLCGSWVSWRRAVRNGKRPLSNARNATYPLQSSTTGVSRAHLTRARGRTSEINHATPLTREAAIPYI